MSKGNAFKVACIYIGTVIGAGFASGQEIVQFFAKYGIQGVYGIVLATVLFGFTGTFILLKVYKYKIKSYHEGLVLVFGHRMGMVVECILSLLLLSWYCVMLAGSGALFEEYLDCSKEMGILLMSTVTFAAFIFSIKGLTIVNGVLVPLLFIGIILMGVLVIINNGWMISNEIGTAFSINTGNWVTSSILYVSYNSIGVTMVMASIYPLLQDKGTAIGGGIMGGMGLGFMALSLLLPTLILYTDIYGVEIPMMAVAVRFGESVKMFYGVLLWFAMLTTAVANGFVIIQNIEKKWKLHRLLVCFLFCGGTIPLAQLGFKNLVHTLYPLFGYLGVFIVLFVLWTPLKRDR